MNENNFEKNNDLNVDNTNIENRGETDYNVESSEEISQASDYLQQLREEPAEICNTSEQSSGADAGEYTADNIPYRDGENLFVNPGKNEMRGSYSEIPQYNYNRDTGDNDTRAAEIIYNSDKKNPGSCSFGYVNGDNSRQKPKEKKNNSGALRIVGIIIAAAFTLTFMAFAGFMISDRIVSVDDTEVAGTADTEKENNDFVMDVPGDKNTKTESGDKSGEKVGEVLSVGPNGSTSSGLTVNQIAEKCRPSSVGILVESEMYYFGRAYKTSGVGSGFILSEDGYIATNNHVVEGATKITVVLDDGTEYEAELIGADSITDIAVVKIQAEGLPVMERGNSDDVMVGDLAVAIGTPASIELSGTVTDGIISATNRKIDITDDYGRVIKTMTLIQTNATINPGNSGGPLINRYGQVIGINTLKLTDEFEGIGFAIPINGAISIMNQLIADGTVSDRSDGLVTGSASIGIQCEDITDAEAEYYGIPKGVLVIQINKNSSASKAGLRRGDIILEFEGQKVETTEDINEIKSEYNVGDEVTMRVYRDGDGEVEITFKLDMQAQ